MKDSKTETLAENKRRFKLIPLEPLRQQRGLSTAANGCAIAGGSAA
jgi:hypothetical protein